MPITSKTELCNLALAELGARRITSYESDTTVEANACRLQLDHVIATLLERHQWDFATKSTNLSALPNVPSAKWTNAWQFPTDFVRLIEVSSGSHLNSVQNFAIEGRTLMTLGGGDTLPISYVSSAVPINYWPALFVDAVIYKLAARIAGDVTQNPALADAAIQKLEQLALPAAVTSDARQTLSGENFGPQHIAAQSPLVAARFRCHGLAPYYPEPAEPS